MKLSHNYLNTDNGEILLFNKPLQWTSFDLVKKVKKILNAKKVGHAGTLDPLASGLLVICTNKCTKKINEFQELRKEYTGTFQLGVTTPSYDMETPVNKEFDISCITEKEILNTAKNFTGLIRQMPPKFSAVKIKGERAYNKARKGEDFLIQSKEIEIYEFEISKIYLPHVDFRVVCSKGTYIRSLIHDFGFTLNNGACLITLCRTKIGNFSLKDAWDIKEFELAEKEKNHKLN